MSFNRLTTGVAKIGQLLSNCRELLMGLVLYVALHPTLVEAGILSKSICRPYRQLVDNELFMVVALVVAVAMVIVWKLSPSGQVMTRFIGILAALAVALNLELILMTATGTSVIC